MTSIVTKLPKGVVKIVLFNPFSMHRFYTHRKTSGFLFSGSIEVEHWLKISLKKRFRAIANKCNLVTSPKVPGYLTASNGRVKSGYKVNLVITTGNHRLQFGLSYQSIFKKLYVKKSMLWQAFSRSINQNVG